MRAVVACRTGVRPACELSLVPVGVLRGFVVAPDYFRCASLSRQFIARVIFLRRPGDLFVKTLCTVPNRDSRAYAIRFEISRRD